MNILSKSAFEIEKIKLKNAEGKGVFLKNATQFQSRNTVLPNV